ncbi:MAG: DUF268 domain-containing protein [bacterium]
MKPTIKKLIRIALTPFIVRDYFRFKKASRNRFSISILDAHPQIKDRTVTTGFDRHYVYHTAWAARVLAELKPKKHIDISSSLYFAGIVSAFVPIEFYDYRPANLHLSNLQSKKGDLMSLPFEDNSVHSISCMHTIEHVGLGRYGDPIDPDGDIKAVNELKRVTAKNGSILFVVPIGEKAVIEFNAHRIYTYDQVMGLFAGCTLKEFALISEDDAKGGLIRNTSPSLTEGEHYGCGCFWFIK